MTHEHTTVEVSMVQKEIDHAAAQMKELFAYAHRRSEASGRYMTSAFVKRDEHIFFISVIVVDGDRSPDSIGPVMTALTRPSDFVQSSSSQGQSA